MVIFLFHPHLFVSLQCDHYYGNTVSMKNGAIFLIYYNEKETFSVVLDSHGCMHEL